MSANCVYCQPNVTPLNNQLNYTTSDNVNHTITFETGLYSLSDINTTVSDFTNKAANGNDSALLFFEADESTSKIIVEFNDINTSKNCAAANSIMPMLGFPATSGVAGVIGNLLTVDGVKGSKQAQLNSLQTILVSCNIATDSYINGNMSNVIATFSPNVGPFSNIYYEPVHPARIKVNASRIDYIKITLTDQDGNPLDFTGGGDYDVAEKWNITISISQHEPYL